MYEALVVRYRLAACVALSSAKANPLNWADSPRNVAHVGQAFSLSHAS